MKRSRVAQELSKLSVEQRNSLRISALVAAFSLLAMAALAPIADFTVIQPLRAEVNVGSLSAAEAIMQNGGNFRLAAGAMFAVVLLDIFVAWGLYETFKEKSQSLSLVAAWLRIAYSAVLAVAISQLLIAYNAAAAGNSNLAGIFLDSYNIIWSAGLSIFGMHLILLGITLLKCQFGPLLIAILLFPAGAGYLIDSFGSIISPDYSLSLAAYTFMGEIVLMVYLFIFGLRKKEKPGV